ncbi:MAG: DUF2703 domain-containing protein [Nigerium sp.]|nr:DUF2703 domain-containing protein [Nigerium sp.]
MNAIDLQMTKDTPTVIVPKVTIRWQRLVGEQGGTCARCGDTGTEVQQAAAQLELALTPLGVTVTLEQRTIDADTFRSDVDASNRIWVNDRLLEDWLGAEVGASHCTFCCTEAGADVACRTLVHDGQTYETIPASLIVQAGLMAGAQALSASTAASSGCGCGDGGCCS